MTSSPPHHIDVSSFLTFFHCSFTFAEVFRLLHCADYLLFLNYEKTIVDTYLVTCRISAKSSLFINVTVNVKCWEFSCLLCTITSKRMDTKSHFIIFYIINAIYIAPVPTSEHFGAQILGRQEKLFGCQIPAKPFRP